jgi:hypothetical protein
MATIKFFVSLAVVSAALLSGLFWVLAAGAKVVAQEQNEGVGGGGIPVNVRDHTGVVVDFLHTYAVQSKWNTRAALASAAPAGLGAVAFVLGIIQP